MKHPFSINYQELLALPRIEKEFTLECISNPIGGTVLVVPAAVGSSSSSAILLELIREGTAPAAVVMGKADAILALGVVVARELGHSGPPVLELSSPMLDALPEGVLEVLEDGTLRRVG